MNSNLLIGAGIAGVLGAGTTAMVTNVESLSFSATNGIKEQNAAATTSTDQLAAPAEVSLGEILMQEVLQVFGGGDSSSTGGTGSIADSSAVLTDGQVVTDPVTGLPMTTSATSSATPGASIDATSGASVYSETPSTGTGSSTTQATSTASVDAATSGSTYSEPAPSPTRSATSATGTSATAVAAPSGSSATVDATSSGSSYSDDDDDDDHDDDDHDDDDD
ncbi:MAG: hypothetical protein ACO20C_05705 [Pontimonas sp.]